MVATIMAATQKPPVAVESSPMPAAEESSKKKIAVEIARKDGKTYFKFEIDPRIEEMYKIQQQEERESESWPGLKFYYMPKILDNPLYQEKLKSYRLFDNYGTTIIKENKFNIAWLRTVGGNGEVELNEELSFAELSNMVKQALAFIKEYFDDYYRGFSIKGHITVEL